MKSLVTIFILLFTFINNSLAFSLERKELELLHHKNYKIEQGKILNVHAEGGDVEITPWHRNEVEIKIYGNDNAREKYEFRFDADDQFVTVRGERIKKWNFFSNIRIKYVIKVPVKFNLNVNTAGGDIKVGGVEGEIKLNTSGGDIWADRVSGNLNFNTSGGDIKIYSNDASIIASTSGGDIDLEYSGENKGIELKTSGGDIEILLPAGFDADVELSTSGGDVDCNFKLNDVEKLSRTKVIAKINNGGNKLTAKTSGGDIEVNHR
ncbi:MAG: DUF4097 domain-containing protein [Ignavibacterium album]|uniref:DUF4097 domain-containing protein n=1 Tax=Ignavibacterium album TaxID=591197 RepID=A0A7V2ZHI9_9BACT|nr:DUF4097 family beta strand repeat-containing protein [Ignavibacterium album]MCX8105068.1 DUF4097 domain-containing protein [Ignavibacterium album]